MHYHTAKVDVQTGALLDWTVSRKIFPAEIDAKAEICHWRALDPSWEDDWTVEHVVLECSQEHR